MKKFLICSLMIMLAIFTTACGDSNFWKTTLKSYETLLGTNEEPKNLEFFSGEISYSDNVSAVINAQEENAFSELKTYEQMLKASFEMSLVYYQNFGIITLKKSNGEVVKAHEELRKTLDTLNKSLENLKDAKTKFETRLNEVDNLLTSENAMQELKTYKRAFAALIIDTITSNVQFAETYAISYDNIEEKENADIKYCYQSALTYILYVYNLYAFGEFDEYKEIPEVKNMIDDLISKLTSNFTNENYDEFMKVFNNFKIEVNLYVDSINKIDLNALTQKNEADITLEERSYKKKIDETLSTYTQLMYNSSLKLIAE